MRAAGSGFFQVRKYQKSVSLAQGSFHLQKPRSSEPLNVDQDQVGKPPDGCLNDVASVCLIGLPPMVI